MELRDIKALEVILNALKGLDAPVQERVLRWAAEKLELSPVSTKKATVLHRPGEGTALDRFESLADAWAAAHLITDAERALFVAAYLSKKNGQAKLTGQEINRHLKNLGHRIGSINKAIDSLQDRKPQLMVQTKKSGNTRQARKNYKVTAAGFAAAEKLLQAPETTES